MSEVQTDNKNEPNPGGGAVLLALAFGLAFFYAGGWDLAWGVQHFQLKPLIFSERGVLLRFNNLYYGPVITNRFFDSPVVSWICGMFGASIIASPYSHSGDEKS